MEFLGLLTEMAFLSLDPKAQPVPKEFKDRKAQQEIPVRPDPLEQTEQMALADQNGLKALELLVEFPVLCREIFTWTPAPATFMS
jgi:hypothetical protein